MCDDAKTRALERSRMRAVSDAPAIKSSPAAIGSLNRRGPALPAVSRRGGRPGVSIVVAAHGAHRSYPKQLIENAAIADVTGVHDVISSVEKIPRCGPQQSVRVGDQSYASSHLRAPTNTA